MPQILQDILPVKQFPASLAFHIVTSDQADHAAHQLVLNAAPLEGNSGSFPIGIAYHIAADGKLAFIALSNRTTIYVIKLDSSSRFVKKGLFSRLLLSQARSDVQEGHANVLVGFRMARTCLRVSHATGLSVKGIDPSSTFSPNARGSESSTPETMAYHMFGGSGGGGGGQFRGKVGRLWTGKEHFARQDVGLQAWLAACIGERRMDKIHAVVNLDTSRLNNSELNCLYEMTLQFDILEKQMPTEVTNDFSAALTGFDRDGKFQVQNARYKTRIRSNVRVIMEDTKGTKFQGYSSFVKGKKTRVTLSGPGRPMGKELRHIKVVGRPELTNAEKARDDFVFLLLTGKKTLRRSAFIQALWFPRGFRQAETDAVERRQVDPIIENMILNDSQRTAMLGMVGRPSIVVVHGPPGTGKTTTIATAAKVWDTCRLPVWIVAHSNVAVKNIAESLRKKRVNFRLIVSKEFYEDWHEHLYGDVEHYLVRSDELPDTRQEMGRIILDSCVVLSTLSMLSHPKLHDNGTFEIVPLERLVIDEASQINVYEFMHLFDKFEPVLKKLCFFGDPKQLPPFGKDDAKSIQTIFDLKHIMKGSKNSFFLDTQYRMPVAIGAFISMEVYDRRLRSEHSNVSSSCLAFVDASKTGEEKAGMSTRNTGEIDTIVHLVNYYYKALNFCVITPYDAQRAAIEKALKEAKLPWETVYNVDSFQGNEADYVLVSVVRTARPGFLSSLNRMNVLLTRCKKGMVIVSSRAFLEGKGRGSKTLLGKLVRRWTETFPSHSWIDWRSVANRSADLPGGLVRSRIL